MIGLAAGAGLLLGVNALRRRVRQVDFDGKVVLITGGSRGLGLVIAREFADLGAKLAIVARDPDELEIAKRDLGSRGANVFTAVCDVTEQDAVNQAVDEVRAALGRID